jgi:hypothetical protein
MAEVDWEVKEVMGQHSQYVDILLRVRGECVGSGGNTAETVKLVLCY